MTVLISWKTGYTGYGGRHYVGLCARVEPEQEEVVRILEAYPGLAGGLAIEEALRLAHNELTEWLRANTDPLRQYSLDELMKPPLTAFGPAGATPIPSPDLGDWEKFDPDDDVTLESALEKTDTLRLGQVVQAWWPSVAGETAEIIEHWCADFYAEDLQDGWGEAECYYRYPTVRPDSGLVYPSIESALRGAGGRPLAEAVSEGLAHGLAVPPDDDWP